MGKVVGVNQDEAVGKLPMVGIEHVQADEFPDEVALTVEEREPEFFFLGSRQIFQNEELQTLGFPVSTPRDNM